MRKEHQLVTLVLQSREDMSFSIIFWFQTASESSRTRKGAKMADPLAEAG